MNYWKPIALVSTSALVMLVGHQAASAKAASEPVANVGEAQPNMHAALVSLKAAQASLVKAEHDKGGWRAAAIVHTTDAIAETERGIHFDNTH